MNRSTRLWNYDKSLLNNRRDDFGPPSVRLWSQRNPRYSQFPSIDLGGLIEGCAQQPRPKRSGRACRARPDRHSDRQTPQSSRPGRPLQKAHHDRHRPLVPGPTVPRSKASPHLRIGGCRTLRFREGGQVRHDEIGVPSPNLCKNIRRRGYGDLRACSSVGIGDG
jgi:hypothetical protein